MSVARSRTSTEGSVERTIDTVPIIGHSNLSLLRSVDLAVVGGMLLIDKPSGWTSFDVVARLRTLLRIRRIGHCGTLDPMATGLLQICVGPATKLVETFQAGIKEYLGTIRFGGMTPSDDAETEEEKTFPTDHVTLELLTASATQFVGTIEQIPPMYSARKINGERLYRLARKGKVVDRPPRQVTIERFDIERVDIPEVDVRVVCSKGTYIRSLARDLGSKVGSGAYLTALRRLRSGEHHIDDATTIDAIARIMQTERGEEGVE